MALGLPKLRWLLVGAVAAGAWVVYDDTRNPRPPERVGNQAQRSVETKSRPKQPVAAKVERKSEPARTTDAKPIPPKPVGGKPEPQKTALALPGTISRPPTRPEKIVTGSTSRPDKPALKPTFVQTRVKVHLRAQARADAPIIVTLEPGMVMREMARSGDWRLVMGDGRKGWVRADYLGAATFLKKRPKLPVAEVKEAKSR